MNSKGSSNIAVGRAIAYFTTHGYFVFTPIGDHSGAIDLIVSSDGIKLLRVQCKYTEQVHSSLQRRYAKIVYQVDLRNWIHNNHSNKCFGRLYSPDSFDVLFIATPEKDWLLDWPAVCAAPNPRRTTQGAPSCLVLGNGIAAFRLSKPAS
jgi:hypothetical protein